MREAPTYHLAADFLHELNSHFGNRIFLHKEVYVLFDRVSNKLAFSNFVKIGYIEKLSRAKYRIAHVPNKNIIVEAIRKHAEIYNRTAKAKYRQKQNKTTMTYFAGGNKHELVFNEPTSRWTDEQMIAHLKSKGYKILKPTQSYEEI